MARMSRRVLMPLPLRAWSGALLVCTLMFCLGGLARPAVAMPSSMPSMETAAPAVTSSAPSGQLRADAVEYDGQCPMAGTPCATPQATLMQDVQPGTSATGLQASVTCSDEAGVAQPNAPPAGLPPPDLHRLCVSRT